jgi:5-methylcytosine-specific restriction enzyme B
MTMDDWSQFLEWAKRFSDETDLDEEERDFKIATAEKIRTACADCVNGNPGWEVQVGRALSSSNLMAWQFVDDVRKAITANPESFRQGIAMLANADADAGDVESFTKGMTEAGLAATPGNLTSLASIVLMGQHPEQYPPYRASFATDWAKAVGFEPEIPNSVGRYEGMLSLCDELLRRAPAVGLQLRDRLDAQGLAWMVMRWSPSLRWTPLDRAKLHALRAGADPTIAVAARGSGRAAASEAGAWHVLGAGLRGEPSAFDPNVTTWTSAAGNDLLKLIDQDVEGKVGFMAKFETQLDGAADELILLAAEMTYLRLAPLSNVTPDTKVDRVRRVLSWTTDGHDLSPQLEAGLRAPGAFNGGMGYNQQAPSHYQWLCRFVSHWANGSQSKRAEALRDPFVFLDITESTPQDMPNIRHTIEYLAWPGVFPSVVSADHRKKIHANLMQDLGEPSGDDENSRTRDLVALWAHHRDKDTGFADWYHSPYVHRWLPGATDSPRAWLVRPSSGGSALVTRWLDEGFVSLKAEMLGTVPEGTSESEVRKVVKAGYMHLDASQQEATTQAYHRFLTVMKPDDIVATLDHDIFHIGLMTGEVEYAAIGDSRLRRGVAWSKQSKPNADLPAPVPSLLDQQGIVVDMTAAYDELLGLLDVDDLEDLKNDGTGVTTLIVDAKVNKGETPNPPVEPVYANVPPKLPAVTEELAASLYMDRASLQEIVDLIQVRQQIVLYGPPGTGKTYVAKVLAKHLVEDPSRVRLVQFHPSYAYEDFFEGYRPAIITTTTESGVETSTPTFELRPGPLKQLASDCVLPENRGIAHFLIIDEMNRANLAKVFGELYFLLEYRNESVQLQYQQANSAPFHLPMNLFIIGTMNTADRSIALVDSAIRRRFPFYEMHPSHEPVKSVLERYLVANHLPADRAGLLAALNESMGADGRDLHIGPSYLMRPDADQPGGIDRVWTYDIMPLLEEHFYGQIERTTIHERFGLAAITAAAAKKQAIKGESSAGGDTQPIEHEGEETISLDGSGDEA